MILSCARIGETVVVVAGIAIPAGTASARQTLIGLGEYVFLECFHMNSEILLLASGMETQQLGLLRLPEGALLQRYLVPF